MSKHTCVKWLLWCAIAYSLKTDRNVFCLNWSSWFWVLPDILCYQTHPTMYIQEQQMEMWNNVNKSEDTKALMKQATKINTNKFLYDHGMEHLRMLDLDCLWEGFPHKNRGTSCTPTPQKANMDAAHGFAASYFSKGRVFGAINEAVVVHTTVEANIVAASSAHKPSDCCRQITRQII